MSDEEPVDASTVSIRRTARDPYALIPQLQTWLATQLPEGADPQLTIDRALTSNVMSSAAVLGTVIWSNGINDVVEAVVIRISPMPSDVPLFPVDNLQRQYQAMRTVAELSDVPVPQVRWLEPTGTVVGSPFFCMRRVEGEAPPDLWPYTMSENWLRTAGAEHQAALQEATVEVLAKLHDIPQPAEHLRFLEYDLPGATHLARHLAHTRLWYEFAASDAGPVDLVEEALDWLSATLPDDDSVVLSWGDARIGNILYHDFTPEAVIDWEMAALGPREIDLAWLIMSHLVFQRMALDRGLPGMPDFMSADEVLEQYLAFTGYRVRNFPWFRVYAATIWTIVFMRTSWRRVHFGELARPRNLVEVLDSHPVLLDELARARRQHRR